MPERNILIKIDESRPSSRHILDLKKKSPPSLPFQGGERARFAKELLVFGIAKTLIAWIYFIPKALRKILSISGGRLASVIQKKFCKLAGRKNDASSNRPVYPVRGREGSSHTSSLREAHASNGVFFDFTPPLHWSRAIGAFIAVAFIMVLPIKAFSSYEELNAEKDKIISQSLVGYEQLKNSDFQSASVSFASAKKTIESMGFLINHLASFVPGIGEKLNLGNGLLIFGRSFADAAKILQEAVNHFDTDIAVTDKIEFLRQKIKEAIPHMLVANEMIQTLEKASGFFPINLSPIKSAIEDSTRALLIFDDFSGTLLDILGDKHFKRYLVIFQNNNEIRPTGGFMGSFAVVDVDRGKIKAIDIPGGGTYDVKGQLTELVIAPEPFHLINSAWQFQDSNWFPDFSEAAKKMMWFYEKSGGPSVDGVVAINATLMEDLLRLIGPIEMPEYGRIMDADNFVDETQKIVELEYDKIENKPKQIIADMTPKVLDKLLKIDAKNLSGLAEIAHQAILEKDILLYAKDEETENQLIDFGLSGKLRDIAEFTDYLMLVDTNIAGQKTDGKIIKEIKHESEIGQDGSIINTVTITRRHTGVKGALFSGVRNVDYMRLYVPQGSEFLGAAGFGAPSGELFKTIKDGYSPDKDLERVQGPIYVDPKSGTRINNEFGRTVFGNWIMVDPGQESVVTFKYKLPYKLGAKDAESAGATADNHFFGYTILVEKQPGAKNTVFKSYVKVAGAKVAARVGNGVALQDDGWQYETNLNSDKYYGIILE